MTVPDSYHHIRVRPLPDYEPEIGAAPQRWSSLRPVAGPQLVLPAPSAPGGPPPESPVSLWRLLTRVLEVLDGRRTIGQLRTLLPDIAFEALLTRLRTTGTGHRHVLQRIRTCYPTREVVELSAVIRVSSATTRDRVIAAAGRFEREGDEWRCTVLRLL
jgi:hypothetical protein